MRMTLLGSTAVALVLALAPVHAQSQQQKGAEEKLSPQAAEKNTAKETAEPKGSKGSAQNKSNPNKGSEQSQQSKDKDAKGTTAQSPPRRRVTKGSAQTQPKDQDRKGSAQTQPKDQDPKGSAQTQPKDQGTKGSAQTQPKEQDKSTASKSEKSGDRVQLSEQQRTSVHQTVLKEKNVNRVNQVNFSISVGTRVPRSVHLVALPASVISLVPQYRSYQYFVANDEICIVDPSSYEIVEVIAASDRTARGGDRGGSGMLTLTAEEKHIIIENVEMRGDSTLALGSLSEGSPVPREAACRRSRTWWCRRCRRSVGTSTSRPRTASPS